MRVLKTLNEYPYISVDVETRGLRWWIPNEGIFGIAIAYPDGKSIYFDIRRQPEGLAWLRKQKPKKVVNHNIKFDLHMLWSIGVMWEPEICECTMMRASLIDENLVSYSLDNVAKEYIEDNKDTNIYIELDKLYGGGASRNAQIKNLYKAPAELVANYAKKDTELALRLWEWQEKEIVKQGLTNIFNLEQKLFPAVFDMERRGVKVDIDRVNDAIEKLTIEIDKTQKELNRIAGFECNPNPSGDIQKLFNPKQQNNGDWVACDGTVLPSTPSGKPSISAAALREMTHPAANLILKIRKWMKCRDTFLKGHILRHVNNGVLHPNINQVKGDLGGTGSGRFSYTRPALQQIPARDKEIAAIMRPVFIPDEGHLWGCWDYSQFEFRMFSHYVNAPHIIEMYAKNPKIDYHQMVADLTGLPRNAPSSGGPNAKQLNLSMIYDMGEASIAKTLNLPLEDKAHVFMGTDDKECTYYKAGTEAKEIINKYHDAIPGVKKLLQDVKSIGKSRGYIISIAGRHMRYPKGKGLYKAKAILCQGSSADCMKQKIIEIYEYFKNEEPECRMYLSVHDEINLGIPKDHPKLLHVIRTIRNILETFDGKKCPIDLRVPIKTDFGIGYNWAQASGKGN